MSPVKTFSWNKFIDAVELTRYDFRLFYILRFVCVTRKFYFGLYEFICGVITEVPVTLPTASCCL